MSEEMTPEEEAEKLIIRLAEHINWFALHKDFDMIEEKTCLMGLHRLLDDHFKPALERSRRLNAKIQEIDTNLYKLGKPHIDKNYYKFYIQELKDKLNLLRNI